MQATTELVSPARGARMLGLDPRVFKKIIDRGELKTITVSPSRRMINVSDLLDWANGVTATRRKQAGDDSAHA